MSGWFLPSKSPRCNQLIYGQHVPEDSGLCKSYRQTTNNTAAQFILTNVLFPAWEIGVLLCGRLRWMNCMLNCPLMHPRTTQTCCHEQVRHSTTQVMCVKYFCTKSVLPTACSETYFKHNFCHSSW